MRELQRINLSIASIFIIIVKNNDEVALCDKLYTCILSNGDKYRFLFDFARAFYFIIGIACSLCRPSLVAASLKRRLKNCFSNIDFWHDINKIYAARRALMYHMLQTGPIPILSFIFKRLIYDRLLCALVNVILVSRGSITPASSGTN